LADGKIEPSLEIDECLLTPQMLFQLLARDHLSRPFQQIVEQLERLELQGYRFSSPSQFSGSGSKLEITETEKTRRASGHRNASGR
jgi:hypothetical protein